MKHSASAFSLVELLICLAIMGALSAFTVPMLFKMPASNQTDKQTAKTKDVAFMIVAAYEQYKASHASVPTTLTADNLMQYMNYVTQMSSSQQLDSHANDGGIASNCTGASTPGNQQPGNCYTLHNGGALWADTGSNFGGSTTQNVLYFRFDPNKQYDGAVNDASGMAIQLALYYDGVMKTRGTLRTNTTYYSLTLPATQVENSVGNEDPAWFTGF